MLVCVTLQCGVIDRKMVENFAAGVVDTSGKFATGVIDTSGNFTYKYLREFSKKFETVLMDYYGAGGKRIHEKKSEAKIPLNEQRHCAKFAVGGLGR
jgi:hypothetical protein